MQRRGLMMTTAATMAGLPAVAEAAGLPAGAESLDALLRPLLASHGLPALAAAVVRGGAIVAAGAVGTRRAGADIPVTLHDRFHIGSNGKAMTALLAATFVEAGALRWETTLAETFPDLAAAMDPGLRGVTLEQLLSHSSGLPSDNEAVDRLVAESLAQGGMNLDELRLWLLRRWAPTPLEAPAGTRFAYSNLGYIFAGAMLEKAGGATWEELMVARIFAPLGLESAGFGPQAHLGRVDAPLGHWPQENAPPKPMLAGPGGDNPLILGPAGTVNISLLDFAAWAGWNAGLGRRGPALVRPETLQRLHRKIIDMPPRPEAPPGTPARGGYALGWGIFQPAWAPEPLVAHGGSNQMNLASIMLRPRLDFALVLLTNIGGTRADQALQALAETLHGRFAPAG